MHCIFYVSEIQCQEYSYAFFHLYIRIRSHLDLLFRLLYDLFINTHYDNIRLPFMFFTNKWFTLHELFSTYIRACIETRDYICTYAVTIKIIICLAISCTPLFFYSVRHSNSKNF